MNPKYSTPNQLHHEHLCLKFLLGLPIFMIILKKMKIQLIAEANRKFI